MGGCSVRTSFTPPASHARAFLECVGRAAERTFLESIGQAAQASLARAFLECAGRAAERTFLECTGHVAERAFLECIAQAAPGGCRLRGTGGGAPYARRFTSPASHARAFLELPGCGSHPALRDVPLHSPISGGGRRRLDGGAKPRESFGGLAPFVAAGDGGVRGSGS